MTCKWKQHPRTTVFWQLECNGYVKHYVNRPDSCPYCGLPTDAYQSTLSESEVYHSDLADREA